MTICVNVSQWIHEFDILVISSVGFFMWQRIYLGHLPKHARFQNASCVCRLFVFTASREAMNVARALDGLGAAPHSRKLFDCTSVGGGNRRTYRSTVYVPMIWSYFPMCLYSFVFLISGTPYHVLVTQADLVHGTRGPGT